MKRKVTGLGYLILVAGIVASLVLSSAASQNESGSGPPAEFTIKSYREIPGITDDEIHAIEAFKKAGRRFSYASLATTETYRQSHGIYTGFTVKFSELLSNLLGIPFDLHVLEWDKLINGINSKYYDFTGELTPTPEREGQYGMTYPIVERALVAFSLAGSARIEHENDLGGKRVGFLADAITAQTITESYPSLNFVHVSVSSTQDAIEKLQAGVIDAFVNEAPSSVVFAGSNFSRSKELFSMVYTPISLTTANPELKPIISVIDKFILSGGFNKIHELYISENNEYNKYAFNASLTAEEAEYLRNLSGAGAKVPVAFESQLYPISFYNKQDEEYQGIAQDLLDEISTLTGIVFDIVTDESSSWSRIFEMLQTGEVALVSELLHTKDRVGKFLFSDRPYATCHYALLSKLDYPNLERYQVPFANVGVVTDTAPAAVFEDYFPNHKNVKHYQHHADALDALERGEVDLLMASEYQLLDFIHYREKPGYKINRQMSVPLYESYFGFNVNETFLHSIFNKAIKQIDVSSIEKKWISRSFDYQKVIAAAREQEANQRFIIASWFAVALFIALVTMLAFIVRYIAAKETAEEQRLFIIEEHKRLQTVLDMLPVGVIIMRTGNEAPLYTNKAIARIFKGEFEKQVAGQTSNKFLPDFQPDGRKSIDAFNEYVQQATPIVEIQCLKVDGEPFIARFTTCRINYQGELCSLGIVEDVTAEKDYQQKLQDIAQKEYEANQAKSDFLAKMSHEIRTPMNAILGMSELALRENMSDVAYEHLFTVKQAGIHLLAIINDVLDFSKIETGKMELIPAEYSFSSLVNDVINIIRVRLFDTQVRFVVNVDSHIPNSLIGDVTRIRQVLINILGNAVKYTDKGFVSLSVHGDVTDDGIVMLSMVVKDSGRGIKKEDLRSLFSEYMQIEVEKNKGIEGIGLGLAISLSLVKAMDGHITVDSEYGKGSTFTVTLPQRINKPDKFALVESMENMRIILYERRVVYSDSIKKSLGDLGVPYMPVTNELELCEEMPVESYPFIFVACELFNKNREHILQAVGRSRLVLLAEFGEAISEGNWSVLGLPAHALSIANILNGVAEDDLYSANAKPVAQFSAPNAKILVVDDISTNLKVAEGLLKPYGMAIDLCKSGMEAITAVKKKEYDLVFMDHRMPDMDGVETTKRIRALSAENSHYATLPIIALTANAVSGVKDVFLESGFNDYLSKPIDTGKLYTVLEKWLRGKHGERKAEAVQCSGGELDAGIHIEGIDTAKGLRHLGGQMEFYVEILELFCDDGQERIEAIRACLDTGNLKTYTTHVHALKSAAANIGACKLSDAARDLEMAGGREDTSYIEAHNEKFLTMLEKLLGDIKSALPSQKEGNQIDMDSFTEELIKLKHALEMLDARSITLVMDNLKGSAPEQHAEAVRSIARNILMSEYDEAVACIEATLQKI